jgi:hypothetical protein
MRNFFKSKPKAPPTPDPKEDDDARTLASPKPLSELYLIGRDTTGMARQSRGLTFHLYKNQPALYNLDLSTGMPVLRDGSATKGPGLAWAQATDVQGEYKVVQSRDKLESKLERIGKDDYRWSITASQWALKGAPVDEEATLVEITKAFQWLRVPRIEGRVPGFGNPDWKLVDRSTGEVHAVFVEKWDFSNERGEVQFRRSFGNEWEMGVLVTLGVVEEKERVRKSSRGNFTMGMMLV